MSCYVGHKAEGFSWAPNTLVLTLLATFSTTTPPHSQRERANKLDKLLGGCELVLT
jgi:hypothetical protein